MSTVYVQLFGGFHLTYADVPVASLNQARQQSLLAYLLLHRHTPQTRQHLAFRFWPDSTEAQARANLRRALHDLRHGWPAADQFLQREDDRVQWWAEAPLFLDVAEFERQVRQADEAARNAQDRLLRIALETAVALYQGDLLPECYDDWIVPERERWRAQFLQTLERLIQLLEAQRDYTAAITYAQRLLRYDPLHESTYRHLMRLYALNSERASALRVYHTCVTVLQRELGVEPDPLTQEAYAHLLNLTTPSLPLPTSAARAARLVGRQAEWAKLQAAWRTVVGGHAHFVLIAGEAGIGKTRLAEELLQWAGQQGLMTARTRSYASEGDLAYAPVIEWLRSGALQDALARLEPVWLTEVARLLPELLAQQPTIPRPEPLSERWQRQRLFEALVRAFLRAKQPLLLVIDDLQWCDQETLEWLHYLLRFDVQARLLIVGTLRSDEVGAQHPLTALLLHLRANDQVTEFELGALNEKDTTALAAQVIDQTLTTTVAKQFYQASEGNPLFVIEIARAGLRQADAQQAFVLTDLPPKVHAVIQTRLHQLSTAAHELVGLAATVGRAFPFAVLRSASDQDEATLIHSLDELWQKRIIRQQDADAYDFSHDRIRNVAYAEMSIQKRRFLHKRVAQALIALYGAQDTSISGQLAFHYEQAQLLEKAMRCYRQAADASAARYAFADALLDHERVLTLIDKLPNAINYRQEQIASWLQIAQIITYLKGWTARERKQALERAYDLIQQVDDKRWLFDILRGLRVYYANIGDWHTAFRYAQEALQVAEATQDLRYLYYAYQGMATAYLQRGEPTTSLHYFHQIRDVEARLEATYQPDITSRARMAEALWLTGYPEQAKREAAEALRLAEEQRHPHGQVHARDLVMCVYQWLADIPAVSRLSAETNTLAEQFGFPNYAAAARFVAGWATAQRGAGQAGQQQMIEALAASEQIEERFNLPYLLALLAQVQAQNGQLELALQTITQACHEVEKSGDRLWQAELVRLTGEFRQLLQDEPEAVISLYRAALAIAHQQGAKSLELRATISLARLWQQQGRPREARQLLAEMYAWFSEGFDTDDLQAAKALLDQLSA